MAARKPALLLPLAQVPVDQGGLRHIPIPGVVPIHVQDGAHQFELPAAVPVAAGDGVHTADQLQPGQLLIRPGGAGLDPAPLRRRAEMAVIRVGFVQIRKGDLLPSLREEGAEHGQKLPPGDGLVRVQPAAGEGTQGLEGGRGVIGRVVLREIQEAPIPHQLGVQQEIEDAHRLPPGHGAAGMEGAAVIQGQVGQVILPPQAHGVDGIVVPVLPHAEAFGGQGLPLGVLPAEEGVALQGRRLREQKLPRPELQLPRALRFVQAHRDKRRAGLRCFRRRCGRRRRHRSRAEEQQGAHGDQRRRHAQLQDEPPGLPSSFPAHNTSVTVSRSPSR